PAGAWLVLRLVAATPLSAWAALGRDPAQVAGLDVHDGWRAVLWQGWAEAALRERDSRWARALLEAHPPPGVPSRARDDRALLQLAAGLLALVPPTERV